ncbi:ribosome silencing factor [Teichococcus rhizosphaerae]|uniref:ribosome silencing factor n=1 Tax=Teichococcus rhizosphaerae TaxID=1335062 RepID=UPI0038CF4BBF
MADKAPRGAAASRAPRAEGAKSGTRAAAASRGGARATAAAASAPRASAARAATPRTGTSRASATAKPARAATPTSSRAPRATAAAGKPPRAASGTRATAAGKAPRSGTAPRASTARSAPRSAAGSAKAAPAKATRGTATKAVTPAKKAEPKAKPATATIKTRKPPKRAKLSPPQIELIVQSVVRSLEDDKAEDVVVLDIASRAAFADRMVVATGLADRQIQAMATHLEKALAEHGIRRIRTETSPDWVLLDAGDLIVHLFKPEARANYRLEKMWGPDSPPADGTSGAEPEEAPIPSLTEAEWMQDDAEEAEDEGLEEGALGDDDILDSGEEEDEDEEDGGAMDGERQG